ncbi:hypothetical protein OI18_08590 [Flavihumibacter solisilvae]|jgi:hypothetical protein|uniref:Outer membrane protein beta-barrel domain-containing protein n=2 Tax=Flavihumibacter solisilvae TaxID=1349421 RepID=A0A0C1L4B2_9BACT|nr:hypothetical protein OI18_08590 [Flavihumibacter solisilvae]
MPMISDSSRNTHYLTMSANFAGANDQLTDYVFVGQAKWHYSMKIANNVQGFIGAQFSAGTYEVRPIRESEGELPYYVDIPKINNASGIKYTGAAGLNGGFAFVVPMGSRHEWRIFGVEGSVSREFGDYMQFREMMPDSIVTFVDKGEWPATLGGFTEWVFRPSNPKVRLGFQLGWGTGINRLVSHTEEYRYLRPRYFYQTFHFTRDNVTTYFSGRFGNYFAGFQFGLSFRLK